MGEPPTSAGNAAARSVDTPAGVDDDAGDDGTDATSLGTACPARPASAVAMSTPAGEVASRMSQVAASGNTWIAAFVQPLANVSVAVRSAGTSATSVACASGCAARAVSRFDPDAGAPITTVVVKPVFGSPAASPE